MKSKYKIFLFFTFLLALTLRFLNISKVPACISWDEASIGYNAYSILTTGKDEYGVSFPLLFKSIGDYKFPLLIYSLVPIIKLFGLNVFSLRFLQALLGSITVIVVFYLIKRLVNSSKVALLTSFFLAISPWHIQFTREGVELGISFFFTTLGILLFIKAIQEKKTGFLLSFIVFSLSLYTYFAERVFIPLILVFSFIYFFKKIRSKFPNFLFSGIISSIILIPMFLSISFGGHQEKFLKTTIFGFRPSETYVQELLSQDSNLIAYNLFHNESLEKVLAISNHYLNHFSVNFLFLKGAYQDLRQYIYGMGVLYLFDLPLIILGLAAFLKKKNKYKNYLIFWLLIAPIPSAITRDPVHARRSFHMLIPLITLSSFGVLTFVNYVKTVKSSYVKRAIYLISALIFLYFFAFYLVSYHIISPTKTYKGASGFQCGYKELVEQINSLEKDKYDRIIVDTSYQGPYIFFLFYEKYPPKSYQSQADLIQASVDELGEGPGYDKYVFRPIYWPEDRFLKNTLFAGPPERLPEKDIDGSKAKIIDKVLFVTKEVAFVIVETK